MKAQMYPWIEKTLDRLGLWKAIQGFPGMVAVVLPSVAATFFAFSPVLGHTELAMRIILSVIVGTSLGLIGYFLGNFWDSLVFDPLYGSGGSWCDRDARPYHLFPAGADLSDCRRRAVEALFPPGQTGKGIYRAAESRAMRHPKQWSSIEQPLVLSKFIRSLIWPSVLLSIGLCIAALWSSNRGISEALAAGLAVGLLSVLLFVPYFHLRVEHMMRLYEYVASSRSENERK